MQLVKCLHVIPQYNPLRAPADLYKTTEGTQRWERLNSTLGGWRAGEECIREDCGGRVRAGPRGASGGFLGREPLRAQGTAGTVVEW